MPPVKTANDIDTLCVNTIRFLAVDAVEKANSGHPGAPMEAAPLAYVLWTRLMRHNPKDPGWANRDRFVLSAGHASTLLYGMLHLTGYDLSLDDLKNFRQWDSRTPGHPENVLTPGVEVTSGPLGQGFGNGVGMAIGERYLAARFNRPGFPIVDHRVYAFVSDGDVMEGVAAEAASLAGHLKLGKLKYVYLDNRITIEGGTDLAFSEDVARRFEAYGWEVLRIPDVHDLAAVEKTLKQAAAQTERPTLVIARTHIGYGSPNKADTPEAHGSPLGAEEVKLTKKALDWPLEPAFLVPEEALRHFRASAHAGVKAQDDWRDLFRRYKAAHPELAEEWERLQDDPVAGDWAKKLPAFKPGEGLATRSASGKVINALAPLLPGLIGGSADLAPSTSTLIKDGGSFSAANPAGRNLHFGIREHAMGAIANGLALTKGIVPYTATFLVFADYMKASIRLAALSALRVIYVMTHDSVGLGEDGPTHQPVEQLAGLRAIPNLVVFRPADGPETAAGWKVALERKNGPTLLVLTRQKLPALDRAKLASEENAAKGAYVLSPGGDRRPQVILIATGSEVHLALEAQAKLEERSVAARVVSMPSWELFDAQPATYREEVLPSTIRARVGIEAGSSLGWHKYVGPQGELVTLDRFGASAPGEVALDKLGFNADNVVAKALALLSR